MHMAGTDPSSLAGETRTPNGTIVDGDGLTSDTAGPDVKGAAGEETEQPEMVEAALAVEVSGHDVAVAALAESIPAVAPDPQALDDEFRDFDLAFSTLVRLSLKRGFDVLAASVALLVLLPLLLIIAAAIKLTDGGPIFFLQRRVGRRGETFCMLKFRSMVVHAERLRPRLEVRNESNGPVFKMRLDPRVTPIGRLIRKYSLDELPQLINVLVGEMSIVGPRPPLPSEVARYEPWHYRRFAVRPGLTCFWQVCHRRYQVSFDDWMRLDLEYVEKWTLRLDMDLLLRTFQVVLAGTGE